MAQIETKQLVLQVDASIELLKQKMEAGERAFTEFELAGERELAKLATKFTSVDGGNLTKSLAALKQDFRNNFTDIQKIAAQAIELPPLKGGGLNLGSADVRAAADQAQKQAMTINLVVASLERQAVATGKLTIEEETRLRAGQAALVVAEKNAAALRQEAGALERLEMDLAATSAQQGIFNAQTRRATVSTGQMRAAQQQLTYNLGDAVTMWGLGAKPMQIFISQASQVTGAIGLMTNSSKGFIGFIGGPWTQVILAAVTVLGVMAANHGDAAKAEGLHKSAADQLKEALDRLNSASADNNHQTRIGIALDIQAAMAARAKAAAKLEELKALKRFNLEEANRAAANADVGSRGAAGGSSVLARGNERDIAILDQEISDLGKQITIGKGQLIAEDVESAFDPRAKANNRFEDQRHALQLLHENGAIDDVNYRRGLGQITADRNRALEAVDKSNNSRRGPSAETIRQREISNDISFNQQLLQARRQLLDATGQSTTSELERDELLKEEINTEADAARTKIRLQQSKGQISAAAAQQLDAVNEAIRSQRLANVAQDRIRATIDAQFTATQHSTDAEIAMLRIKEDMAASNAERRSIARMILAKEQQAALEQLAHIVSTSKSQAEIDQALADRATLLKRQKAERENFDAQPATPGQAYLQGLRREQANLSDSFDEAGINALNRVSTSLSDSVKSALKLHGVLGDIASDFIEIALRQELLLPIANAIWGEGKPGLFGSIATLFGGGFASGGYTGDGSPTDIAGPVHKKEFVFDAAATSRIGIPTLEALRRGTYRGPAISTSRIAGGGTSGMARVQLELSGDIDARIDRRSQNVAIDVVRATAPTIQRAAVGETISTLNRQRL